MRLRVISIIGVLVLSACGTGSSSEPESAEPVATTLATTTTVEPTTTTVSEEQLAIAGAVGDVAIGETLFNTPMDAIPHSHSCATCHLLDSDDTRNPTLAGISTLAIDRVEGLSAVEYLKQSIMDPYALKVEGEWTSVMPYQYGNTLSDEEVNDLIAYLLTR